MTGTSLQRAVAALAVGMMVALASTASAQSDDFNDGVLGSQWQRVVDNPANLDLAETGGVIDVTATPGGSPNDDALYLSNGPDGFRLSTATNFSIAIDYRFTAPTTGSGAVALVLGVGRDLDGTDSAAIGYAYGSTPIGILGGSIFGYRIDDQSFPPNPTSAVNPFAANTGTLTISYDAATDTLTGGAGGTVAAPVVGVVRGTWGADSVFVSFGARGQGLSVPGGTATLDDFNLLGGTVVPVPEPSAGLLGAGVIVGGVWSSWRRR